MRQFAFPALALGLVLAACGSDPADDAATDMTDAEAAMPAEPAISATAPLAMADGTAVGSATATMQGEAVMISLSGTGMPPGQHGVHVHMTGTCEGPTFESAGGHWNPTEQMHGLEGAAGQHAGDMPNLTVAEDGTGSLEYELVGGTWEGLMDADGSAFVVHAMADDQMTDPSGESGDRIACGVFAAG